MRLLAPLGVGPPASLQVDYGPGAMLLNLTAVTGVSLQVERTDGTTATWACTILGASQSTIRFAHAWAVADCPVKGLYRVAPVFTVAGQPMAAQAFEVFVVSPNALTEAP